MNNFDNNLGALMLQLRSAYTHVERKMALLSHELAGLLLPHEHYGPHLNFHSWNIEAHLENKHLKYEGKTLAEIWYSLKIDGYAVNAE